MISSRTLLKSLTKQYRCTVVFGLTLALLALQITGLHFHVHQISVGAASTTPPVIHAAHSDAHTACHQDKCGADVSITEFWKNPDQSWSVLALFAVICVLLLSVRSGRVPPPTYTGKLPHSQPAFLRPPLRAPPL